MSDEPEYPNPPIDSNEGGQIIRTLKDWDVPHSAKAAILVRMAKTEWQFAHAAGEAEVDGEDDFLDFADKSMGMVDEALENIENEE